MTGSVKPGIKAALPLEIGGNGMSLTGTNHAWKSLGLLLLLLGGGICAQARKKHGAAPFKYDGGTEKIPKSCKGFVEVGSSALTFKCTEGSVAVPYSSIILMQYRQGIS